MVMRVNRWILGVGIMSWVVLTAGCGNPGLLEEAVVPAEDTYQESDEAGMLPDRQFLLRDMDSLYEDDEEDSVVTMYLTVRRGNKAEGTDHAWSEINSYSTYDYQKMGIDRYQVEGLLQVGDETGPVPGELGYGENVPNATIQIRGQTSSRNAQKNYKIRIKDNKGLWNSQQTINLNKHQSDGSRFRNKLGYDLLKEIPQLMSLQTQFVHLYVKDETENTSAEFVDYGLYTQVEQLNKRSMRAHGLDPNAHLYKINFCEFYRYEDRIKLATDPTFNETAFEEILECKGDTNHTKLINMLEDINDYSIPTEELIEKHFDMENLTYWMAYHILTGNTDTENRNFYLYSPQNMNTWYIISWDLDAAFKWTEYNIQSRVDFGAWQKGVSNYWGNMLFRRCLKSDEFRRQLDLAIDDLRTFLTEDRIAKQIEIYRPVVESYIWNLPDVMHEPLTPEEYDQVAQTMPGLVDFYYQNYQESLEAPLPFFIGVPSVESGKLSFSWEVSYDFQMEDIVYQAELARDYTMTDIIASYEGIMPGFETDMLPPGQYFIRVKSKDTSGLEQYAFDYYVTERGKAYGIKCFYILPDGSIGEDVYEE